MENKGSGINYETLDELRMQSLEVFRNEITRADWLKAGQSPLSGAEAAALILEAARRFSSRPQTMNVRPEEFWEILFMYEGLGLLSATETVEIAVELSQYTGIKWPNRPSLTLVKR